jgi:NADPH-dependent curcumin reductase CurA
MLYSCSASSQNVNLVVPRAITIHKFIVFGPQEKYLDEFYASIPANLANGEIKYTEEVTKVLGKVGDVPLVLQNGNIASRFKLQMSTCRTGRIQSPMSISKFPSTF